MKRERAVRSDDVLSHRLDIKSSGSASAETLSGLPTNPPAEQPEDAGAPEQQPSQSDNLRDAQAVTPLDQAASQAQTAQADQAAQPGQAPQADHAAPVGEVGQPGQPGQLPRPAREANKTDADKTSQIKNLELLGSRLTWMIAAEALLLGAVATIFPTDIPKGLACTNMCVYAANRALLEWLAIIGLTIAGATFMGVTACIMWDWNRCLPHVAKIQAAEAPKRNIMMTCGILGSVGVAAFKTVVIQVDCAELLKLLFSYVNYAAIPTVFITGFINVLLIIAGMPDCLDRATNACPFCTPAI